LDCLYYIMGWGFCQAPSTTFFMYS
jgi:hypothetical protein